MSGLGRWPWLCWLAFKHKSRQRKSAELPILSEGLGREISIVLVFVPVPVVFFKLAPTLPLEPRAVTLSEPQS